MKNDSYISDISGNYLIAWLKSTLIPLQLLWWLVKFLANPKKSKVILIKQIVVYPILDFFTHESSSDKVLKDYTHYHNSILKQQIHQEDVKISFENHKSILLNAKIANLITLVGILFLYFIGFLISVFLGSLFLLIGMVVPFLMGFTGIAIIVAKVIFGIAGFAVFWAVLKEICITDKEDIKSYLNEIIFYAHLKNCEIFGKEHAQKVKDALFEAYLPQKLDQIVPVELISLFPSSEPQPVVQVSQKIVNIKE